MPVESLNRADLVHYFRRALRYVAAYRPLAVASFGLILVSTASGLLTPWPLKVLVDSVLQDHPLPPFLVPVLGGLAGDRTSLLIAVVVGGFAIAVATNALTVAENYVSTRVRENVALDFRSDLLSHAQRLSLAYHDHRRTGKVIFTINNQGASAGGLVMAVPPILQSGLMLGGMLWIAWHIDAALTLLSLSIVPMVYLAIGYYVRHIQKRLVKVKGMEAESLSMIHEAMQMLRVVTAFGREAHEFRRFRTHGEHTVNARVNVTVQQTAFSLFVNSMTALGTALVLGVGGYFTLQGRLTVGQLLVIMSYIAMVYKPLEQIAKGVSTIQEKAVGMRIGCRLLDEEPEILDAPGARTLTSSRGDVTFEHVSFSYRGRKSTLKDISFAAPAGTVVAIVGPTGAGKTTLVSLIPRFYEVTAGCVRLDGVDIRDVTLESLRQQISIVLQEPLLFAVSIADNIRYGRLDASMDEIVAAAKAANAHEFIQTLPAKYDTVIGERGAQLSGGERQRVSIARALLKDAPILVVDEATSHLDAVSEAEVRQALDHLRVGRTTFMVAHRLSTVRRADLILVLKSGSIVEQGTHTELLALNGLYHQLYEIQTGRRRQKPRPTLVASAAGGGS